MSNLIAKIAITTILAFSIGHSVFAQNGEITGQMKSKAVSTLSADQPKSHKTQTPAGKAVEDNTAKEQQDTAAQSAPADSLDLDMAEVPDSTMMPVESEGFHKTLKVKYIEGNAGFMSFVALVLVLGLAFCIERIIYLTLSEINAKKLMTDLEPLIMKGDIEGAKTICRNTRGPVASICYQGLMRIDESMDDVERSITSYGSVQAANLEKGCSWITLFIAMAPSLGFLGTVIGMVMSFEQIQMAGDISPTIVAAGMKVALITTIFGLIAALIMQVFYNYILSKIEHITSQMEESAITLLDIIMKYKLTR
jgi:biopolymer transport protein ExbB